MRRQPWQQPGSRFHNAAESTDLFPGRVPEHRCPCETSAVGGAEEGRQRSIVRQVYTARHSIERERDVQMTLGSNRPGRDHVPANIRVRIANPGDLVDPFITRDIARQPKCSPPGPTRGIEAGMPTDRIVEGTA